jgi:hypothetical protein
MIHIMRTTVAADALGASISKGELGVNYKNVVNKTYVSASQDVVAFYLLLQAYNSESRRGHKVAADALLQADREELARRHSVRIEPASLNPTALSPAENKIFRKSPLKQEIANTLAGSVLLAFSLTLCRSPGISEKLCPV